jgi:hypothetical protein
MTARDDYPDREETFAAAERGIELEQQLGARAEPVVEGDAGWLYLTKTRRLPTDAVRAALGELRALEPLIEGRDAADCAVVSLLRDGDDAVSGLQLTFHDVLGAPSAKAPKRQSYSLRPNGMRDGLFYAGGGEGSRAFITEGRLEKSIALASLGLGPVYGGGGRTILGCAPPPEPEVVLVSDHRPDDTVVDLQTKLTAADAHARDMKRAVDLLLLAGKTVSVRPEPTCCCCKKRLRGRVGEFRKAVRKHRDGGADSPPGQALRGPSSKQTRAILGRGGLIDPDEAELVAIAAAGALIDGLERLNLAALWRRASSAG